MNSDADDRWFEAVDSIVNRYNQRLGVVDDRTALYLAIEVWHMRQL